MPPLLPKDPRRGRAGRPYRRLWQLVVRPGTSCWICGQPIRWGLRRNHPAGPSLDHVIPLDLGGDPLHPDNARPAHHGCNARRGAALAAAVMRLGRAQVLAHLRTDPIMTGDPDHHSESW